MLNKIFPKTVDNNYKGSKIALYAFYLAVIVTIARSLAHIFLPDGGAQSIATMPLDTFSANAVNAVIFMFAYWGLSQLIMGIFYIIVALRYRSLVPLMYVFIFVEYLMRFIIGQYRPLSLVGTAPGGVLNKIAIPLALIMLVLSLVGKGKSDK
jgi:hypothetical protein